MLLILGLAGTARATFDDKPFDPSVKRLSENYLGHDLERIATILMERRIGPKDEFETTEQARARIRRSAEQTLFGSLRLDALLAVRFPIAADSMKYDADARQMRFNYVVTDPRYASSPATLDSIHGGPSINAYIREPYDGWQWLPWREAGRREVDPVPPWPRYTSRVYGLTLCKRVGSQCRSINRDFFSARLEPEVARDAKETASYLVVGRLAEPWLSRETRSNRPNVPYQPYIITSEIMLLRLQPTAVWIYNGRTGDVYKRLDLEVRSAPSR